jgi:LmbE family N-acetylglucosaminyl deacetylase
LNLPHQDKTILGVFAHPDDETSSCAATFTRYIGLGATVHVITGTGGEMGTLGTGDLKVLRKDLAKVRERELRTVLKMYGAQAPTMLGYRDQELASADEQEAVGKILAVMRNVRPDAVITFGPTGISHHVDHVAIHRFAVSAYDRYVAESGARPRLFYPAIPGEIAKQFDFEVDGPEGEPNVFIDIKEHRRVKVQGLRTYRSQEDAQEVAEYIENDAFPQECFYLARPGLAEGVELDGLFGPLTP